MRFPGLARAAFFSTLFAVLATQYVWAWGHFVRDAGALELVDWMGPERDSGKPERYSLLPTNPAALPELPPSAGSYRLPFADGISVKVFDDFYTHRPIGRVDLFAIGGAGPFRVVAAASGRIVAIQDSFNEQQSGRAAADCHNNYVWLEHPNGEWTNYSHLAHNSVTVGAKLKVGDQVAAGAYLGDEDAIGCAMLKHVHFEVAVPDAKEPIDAGGFLTGNDGGKRERNPKFCGVTDGVIRKDSIYEAHPC